MLINLGFLGLGLFVVWFVLYIGFKIVKWFIHIFLILAIIALVLWFFMGNQNTTYTIPFINTTITI